MTIREPQRFGVAFARKAADSAAADWRLLLLHASAMDIVVNLPARPTHSGIVPSLGLLPLGS